MRLKGTVLKFLAMTVFSLFIMIPVSFSTPLSSQKVEKIVNLIKEQNYSIQATRQKYIASKHMAKVTGYFPDPTFKFNIFGSPIETRNGPQKFNVMLSQSIPWPSALKAEENLAVSQSEQLHEQTEILLLDLTFKAKSLIYKYVEFSEKIQSKNKMILSLKNLSKVALSRLKLGAASHREISRINIEIASLSQNLREIEANLISIQEQLRSMTEGKEIKSLLPTTIDNSWGRLPSIDPSNIDLSFHPLLRLAKSNINLVQAGLEKVRAKRLPMLGTSVSWFKIDKPDSSMGSAGEGKDAWAIGASVTIPIWSGKYDSMEHSQISKLSAVKYELTQRELELRSSIQRAYEELRSAIDISSMFKSDILPQADQVLRSNRESYTQGNVPFESVVDSYIRVIKFENQLIESQIKQATLRALIEKLVGRSL